MLASTNGMPAASAPIRVLLVEDEANVAETVQNGLHPGRFSLRHARGYTEAQHLLRSGQYDAVVLDLNLPDGNGMDIADALREAGSGIAILMLTARTSVEERVDGFRHGADDYLCKPFVVEELSERLQAVVRRSRPRRGHLLRYADVELDLVRRTVRRQDLEASMSSRELDLFVYFIHHAEDVLERGRILEEVWGDEAEDDSNVVSVYVNYLRNKLEQGAHPRLIHTVRGVGYILSKEHPRRSP